MLDMGFMPDVKKVLKRVPATRQTLFFSATMPKEIKSLADEILSNPKEITVHAVASTTDTIKQQVYHIATSNKRKLLQQIVKRRDLSSIIVFVKTKDDTEYVMDYVKSAHIKCDNIHRNRSQNARQRALNALKDGEIKVLIATDVAARGIDVNNLSCVVNYNIPSDPEGYVHRIGRTARAGKD
jgi:ATP-dependent RNA helicase RhlE